MILSFGDWVFDVDIDATRTNTTKNASDHCTCGYCKNYYEAVEQTYPELLDHLGMFGINIYGPSELMPFKPTLVLACYRVCGAIRQWGQTVLAAKNISITVESADSGTFFLWAGEMELPWLQDEDMNGVVSPANLPEFMERMEEIWLLRHGESLIFS